MVIKTDDEGIHSTLHDLFPMFNIIIKHSRIIVKYTSRDGFCLGPGAANLYRTKKKFTFYVF